MASSLVTFLKSRAFIINLLVIIVLASALIYGTLRWVDAYTNHREFVVVPDFRGKKINTLEEFVKGKDVSYQIVDSIYDPKEKAGIVLRQDPEMNSKVKHNRTVYLYVTGMVPPQVAMPKLVDRSERQAKLILNSYGLRLGKVEIKMADCNGCVVEQLKKGKLVEPGEGVSKGSVIDLVIGTTDPHFHHNDSTAVENKDTE
jgi:beta-lactam-binding protein with PASTA domain